MRNIAITRAVSAALAATAVIAANAQQAFIADYAYNQSHGLNVNVFIGGSSAIDDTIAAMLNSPSLNICQPGTVTQYADSMYVWDASGHRIGGNPIEYMYYCQAGISSGVSMSDLIAVFKESTAGSINGVQPLIQVAKGGSSGLTFMNPIGPDVGTAGCFPAGPPVGAGGTQNGGYCTAADFQQNVVPTGGVSDVEASLLRSIPGGGNLAASDIADYLAGVPGVDSVWGIAVTKNLYYALQQAEHLADGTVISGCDVADNDSSACAPSLSKQQISALLVGSNSINGDLLSWNQLIGISNPDGDNNVYICRQSEGAGSTAVFDAAFLGSRCGISSEDVAAQDGHYVIDEANTSGVEGCLNLFYAKDESGQDWITPYNGDFDTDFPAFTVPGNQWAIGILSTEIGASDLSLHGDSFRFIAIDGVLPTLANVVNGYYPYFSTDRWYYINPYETGTPVGTAAFTVFSVILGDIGHPGPTLLVDKTYANMPWGDGGELSPAFLFASVANAGYTAFPVTAAEVLENPINLFTRASSGIQNTCDEPVLYGSWAGPMQNSSAEATLLGRGNVNEH